MILTSNDINMYLIKKLVMKSVQYYYIYSIEVFNEGMFPDILKIEIEYLYIKNVID